MCGTVTPTGKIHAQKNWRAPFSLFSVVRSPAYLLIATMLGRFIEGILTVAATIGALAISVYFHMQPSGSESCRNCDATMYVSTTVISTSTAKT